MTLEQRPARTNESSNESPWDMNTALAHIGVIRQKIMASGSFDSEPNDLDRLIIDVRNGRITPELGVERAEALERSRQDYH